MSHVDVERMLGDANTQAAAGSASAKSASADPLVDPLAGNALKDALGDSTPQVPTALSKKQRRGFVAIAKASTHVPPTDKKSRLTVSDALRNASDEDLLQLQKDLKQQGVSLRKVLKSWSKAKAPRQERALYYSSLDRLLNARSAQADNEPKESLDQLRKAQQEASPDVDRLLTPGERVAYRLNLIKRLQLWQDAETDEAKALEVRLKKFALVDETKKMMDELHK